MQRKQDDSRKDCPFSPRIEISPFLTCSQGLATKTVDPKQAEAMLSAVDIDGNGKVKFQTQI